MKTRKVFILLTIVFFSSLSIFAQTTRTDSSITIKIKNGKYLLSGFVASEDLKNEIAKKVTAELGGNADFSELKVSPDVEPLQIGWQKDFDNSLKKLKSWKTGIFVFSSSANKSNISYPNLPEDLLNAEIFLIDKKEPVKLADYHNKVVVLFFLESWCGPCRLQADELKTFNSELSTPNLQIIGVSTEISPDEKRDFLSFAKRHKFNYQLGWVDANFTASAFKISRFQAIPQTFVVYNGKLYSVFAGGGKKQLELLKANIIKTLGINNLK